MKTVKRWLAKIQESHLGVPEDEYFVLFRVPAHFQKYMKEEAGELELWDDYPFFIEFGGRNAQYFGGILYEIDWPIEEYEPMEDEHGTILPNSEVPRVHDQQG